MRTFLNALLIVFALQTLALADDFKLPRAELDAVIAKAQESKIASLAAELKEAQAIVKSGAKGIPRDRKRQAILEARQREAKLQSQLEAAKKGSGSVPELNVSKLEVGQVGKLYRTVAVQGGFSVPSGNGIARVATTSYERVPVTAEVIQIVSPAAMLVAVGDMTLWLETSTAGMTTGKKLTLDEPVKVIGTKRTVLGETVFQLAMFEEREGNRKAVETGYAK